MSDYIGQIPEEVDQLASDFDLKATDLENLKSAITAKLAGTTWTGADRERFESDWEGQLSPAITSVTAQLRGASDLAAGNAEEQRTASAT